MNEKNAKVELSEAQFQTIVIQATIYKLVKQMAEYSRAMQKLQAEINENEKKLAEIESRKATDQEKE